MGARVVDYFAGAGGFTLGAELAGAHDAVVSVRRARVRRAHVRATRIAADVRREAMARAVADMEGV